ncbi:MAG: DUF3046 domain-containing protein [Actinomyces sp.]|uniref:DUF3046 domain-containing protein n=1 Tax=Actinomyces sp. TaxID=29317 RepID=UPI0026DB4E04|nr:DUF3046 domain-containing protein [Actinomyces sp.]MDO4243350.1 DUF3046 domain-containing protein [Actinomyces sp.]
MRHSEFWHAVDEVFGPAYGRSLTQDLVLPALGSTCVEALEAGVAPGEVWHALCDETEVGDADRWVHRADGRGPARRARDAGL